MFDIQVDPSKNLVRLSWSGRIEPDEAMRCAEQLESRLPELQRGFRLFTDLTDLETMDTACAPFIRRMMDFCNHRGVESVIRVIPDATKDIGLSIMSLFHYHRGIRIVTCRTVEEANAALEVT